MTTTVTDSDTALCNAELPQGTPERETGVDGTETLQPAITECDIRVGWRARVEKVVGPLELPALLTEQRPAAETIVEYARRGMYTPKLTGPVRRGGIAWAYTAAIPVTVIARLTEWVFERFGRFITILVTVKALTFLPPVGWVADHLIKPAAHAALWLFL